MPSSASASTSTTSASRPNSTPSPPRSAANSPAQPQPIRREPLAAAILIALDDEIRALTSNRATCNLATSSLDYSTWILGKRVRVEARDGDPGYTGTTAGLDPNGFLRVTGDDGQLHTVLSGGLREP